MSKNRILPNDLPNISEFKLPMYNEIPNVGLFLEQVSKYINDCLAPLREPELTGSMISNYVKKGIVDNPIKKQYNRDQIAILLFIAIAKTVLGLDDISTLLNLKTESYDTETAYNFFRNDFTLVLSAVFNEQEMPALNSRDVDKHTAKRLSRNVSIAAAHKIYMDMAFAEMKANQE